jgi:hypothetical protein
MNRWNGEDVRMERNTFLLFLFLCVLSLAFSREGIAGTLQAVKQGAKLLWGGESEGLCYYPSVLSRVTEDMEIFLEETFGPVASIGCSGHCRGTPPDGQQFAIWTLLGDYHQ